ncbi:MAG: hypothetical protein V4584_14470 [Verrucomicrobiota bacterium]
MKNIRKKIVRWFRRRSKAEPARKAATSGKPKRIRGRRDNDVQLESRKSLRGTIVLNGKGNVIRFLEGSRFAGSITVNGNDNLLEFGPHTKIRGQLILGGCGQKVTFGEQTTAVEILLICGEDQDVNIGRWCMFSRKIEIRTSDAHSVVDSKTGDRVNPAQPVIIGDHVWVGLGVVISKGARIPSDSIVGAMSFVNGGFEEEGVILAGAPAKIVRRGVTWNRDRRPHFTPEELDGWKADGHPADS